MSATNPSMSWGIPRTNPDARVHLHEHPRLERTGARSRSIEHVTVHNPHAQLMREAGVVHSGSLSEEVCVHA